MAALTPAAADPDTDVAPALAAAIEHGDRQFRDAGIHAHGKTVALGLQHQRVASARSAQHRPADIGDDLVHAVAVQIDRRGGDRNLAVSGKALREKGIDLCGVRRCSFGHIGRIHWRGAIVGGRRSASGDAQQKKGGEGGSVHTHEHLHGACGAKADMRTSMPKE